jgi:hypothetical protein
MKIVEEDQFDEINEEIVKIFDTYKEYLSVIAGDFNSCLRVTNTEDYNNYMIGIYKSLKKNEITEDEKIQKIASRRNTIREWLTNNNWSGYIPEIKTCDYKTTPDAIFFKTDESNLSRNLGSIENIQSSDHDALILNIELHGSKLNINRLIEKIREQAIAISGMLNGKSDEDINSDNPLMKANTAAQKALFEVTTVINQYGSGKKRKRSTRKRSTTKRKRKRRIYTKRKRPKKKKRHTKRRN